MGLLDLVVASVGTESFTIIGSVLAVALGLTGAIVALIKLPADKSAASVVQAQGANEALAQTLEAVERERDYWKDRHAESHARANDLSLQLMTLRQQLED